MSDAVSALNDASFVGYVKVAEQGLRGMITLRADLRADALAKVVRKVSGVAIPKRGAVAFKGERGVCWMSPDELLILVPYAMVEKALANINAGLAGSHFLAVDVSDARAMFRLSGAEVREVVAKLSPADTSAPVFGPGLIRRTRIAQVPAAIWMVAEHEIELVCFRSVAEYVFGLLKNASMSGSEVGLST